jgi:ubiquinone/menaquinone biosynthesis C-methylase UbiE
MMDAKEKQQVLQDFVHAMKHDWDERARQGAKWFINPPKLQQSDEEFEASGRLEIDRLIRAELSLLTGGRDPKQLRLLEIGCGIGRMTRYLAELFGEVYATDVSEEMIRQAQQRLQGIANIRFYETNGCDFAELPSDYFDLAFSAYVYQHVPSAEVIRASLSDAYRVLKPGGVFKFQVNAIVTFDFEGLEKDTWTGAAFPESEIRRFAQEHNAQLVSIFGAGTQYCWATLRKREPGALQRFSMQPRIEFFGCTDDPQSKTIPLRGDHAYLALIVSGINRDEVDINTVSVEIDGQEVLPHYLGPISRIYEPAMKEEFGASLDHLTQIEVRIPIGEPSGNTEVRVRLSQGEVSAPITVELKEPQPIIPKIDTIINAFDYGTEIYASGEKSRLRLYVEGLDETADTGNIRLQIGDRIIKPTYVGFLLCNGTHQIDAQLPKGIKPGLTDLKLYFGNVASPPAQLQIKSGASSH